MDPASGQNDPALVIAIPAPSALALLVATDPLIATARSVTRPLAEIALAMAIAMAERLAATDPLMAIVLSATLHPGVTGPATVTGLSAILLRGGIVRLMAIGLPALRMVTPVPVVTGPPTETVTVEPLVATVLRTGIVTAVRLEMIVLAMETVMQEPLGETDRRMAIVMVVRLAVIVRLTVIVLLALRMVTLVVVAIARPTVTGPIATVEPLAATVLRMEIVLSAILLRGGIVRLTGIGRSVTLLLVATVPLMVIVQHVRRMVTPPLVVTARRMGIVLRETLLLAVTARSVIRLRGEIVLPALRMVTPVPGVTGPPTETGMVVRLVVTDPLMVTDPSVILLLVAIAHRTVTALSARALPRTLVSEPAENGLSAFGAALSKRR